MNRKFKIFDILDTLKVHIHYAVVQLPYKDLLHQAKLAEKKQQINVLNTLHPSVSDLKSVIAMSSRGGIPPPFTGLGGALPLLTPRPPLYTPLIIGLESF